MPYLDIIPFSSNWETIILTSASKQTYRVDIHDLRARIFVTNDTFDSPRGAHQWEKRYDDYNSVRYEITQEEYEFLVDVYITKLVPYNPSTLYFRYMVSQLCALEPYESQYN